jgi:hypothetical protein
MNAYTVTWTTQVMAESPIFAAVKADEVMKDPNSTALEFEVRQEGRNATVKVNISDLQEYINKQEIPA